MTNYFNLIHYRLGWMRGLDSKENPLKHYLFEHFDVAAKNVVQFEFVFDQREGNHHRVMEYDNYK